MAVSQTALAIIGPRVLSQVLWSGEVSRWRLLWHASVERLDLSQAPGVDGRRLEVVAEGLSLIGGAQLAIDATLVSALHGDGTARAGSATRPGAALVVARRRKERTYPELAGEGRRARLVVLAGEVGGRWSAETASFLTALAQHKAQGAPELLKGSVEAAWRRRWAALLSCAAAKAFAASLLGRRSAPSASGNEPTWHEVLGEDRYRT